MINTIRIVYTREKMKLKFKFPAWAIAIAILTAILTIAVFMPHTGIDAISDEPPDKISGPVSQNGTSEGIKDVLESKYNRKFKILGDYDYGTGYSVMLEDENHVSFVGHFYVTHNSNTPLMFTYKNVSDNYMAALFGKYKIEPDFDIIKQNVTYLAIDENFKNRKDTFATENYMHGYNDDETAVEKTAFHYVNVPLHMIVREEAENAPAAYADDVVNVYTVLDNAFKKKYGVDFTLTLAYKGKTIRFVDKHMNKSKIRNKALSFLKSSDANS